MNIKTYRRLCLTSMTESELIAELLNKASGELRIAQSAMETRNHEALNNSVIHAQKILAELESIMKNDSQESKKAAQVLKTLIETLIYANVNRDEKVLNDVFVFVQQLAGQYYLLVHQKER